MAYRQQNFVVRTEQFGADLSNSKSGWDFGGAGANTLSSAQIIGTGGDVSPAFDWHAMLLTVLDASAGCDAVIQLGWYDTVGGVDYYPLVENLRLASRKAAGDWGQSYYIPVHVPAGKLLRVKAQTSSASATVDLGINGFSRGLGGMPGFSRMQCITTLGTTRGTAIDPGTTPNTKPGSYTQLVASTANRYGALMFSIGHNADVARAAAANALLDIAIGAAASERNLLENLPLCWTTTSDTPQPQVIPAFPCDIPAASRLSARMQCSDATAGDRLIDLIAYGFIP